MYGLNWVYEAFKFAKEYEYEERVWDLSVLQTTHTPQSKKGSKDLSRYIKKLKQSLDVNVPWLSEENTQKKRTSKPRRMEQGPKPKVILEDVGNLPKDARDFFNSLEGKVEIEKKE